MFWDYLKPKSVFFGKHFYNSKLNMQIILLFVQFVQFYLHKQLYTGKSKKQLLLHIGYYRQGLH